MKFGTLIVLPKIYISIKIFTIPIIFEECTIVYQIFYQSVVTPTRKLDCFKGFVNQSNITDFMISEQINFNFSTMQPRFKYVVYVSIYDLDDLLTWMINNL